ncbi:MAG: endonuclease/exonuclease/phosphatase family protein [Puniceicoccales bacterium]|jgi:endonuclease/exonuclease/phosphatase family metal-dependent hydrolase|nr:endonuclease/exonuclease/phosphatase family protein [Puniceicoccales bacterium]
MNIRCRLITFNIAHGRGLSLYQGFVSQHKLRRTLKAIGAFARESEADILALQEVDLESHWNRGVNLLAAIQSESNHPFGVLGVNNRRVGRRSLAYGNGLLSHFPIAHWENFPFGNATLGEKGFLHTELKIHDKILPVVNLHLDFRSAERRVRQLEKLVAHVRGLAVSPERFPPLFCGDFNCGPRGEEDAFRQLDDALRDTGDYRIYPVGEPTFPSLWPQQKLDFVFLPACFRVCFCEVPRIRLSDHCPVLLEFETA